MVLRRLRDPRRIRHAGPARKNPRSTPRHPHCAKVSLRERVADPSATRVGRVRGSFVFLTMQRTPHPARTSQSSVLVARGSPRPAERSPAQSALRRSRLWSAGPSTMPERVPAIARPSGLRTPLRAEAKLDKLPALEAQKRRAAVQGRRRARRRDRAPGRALCRRLAGAIRSRKADLSVQRLAISVDESGNCFHCS